MHWHLFYLCTTSLLCTLNGLADLIIWLLFTKYVSLNLLHHLQGRNCVQVLSNDLVVIEIKMHLPLS